ncbi:uncharacterized protein [Antedon mediterranea]|uniref:uncharacterized protein n=1 Tax=Antedon mediterranea TaxID=105859 RepID=UPI003AF8BF71
MKMGLCHLSIRLNFILCFLGLFAMIGTTKATNIKVRVNKGKHNTTNEDTIDMDGCFSILNFRVKEMPTDNTTFNLKIELISDGEQIDLYETNSYTLKEDHDFTFNDGTVKVHNGTLIKLTVYGKQAVVRLQFNISMCLETSKAPAAVDVVKGNRNHMFMLILLLGFILALLVSIKYHNQILTKYRDILNNYDGVVRRTRRAPVNHETITPTHTITVNAQPADVKYPSIVRNTLSSNDYAELRMSDTYAIPDIYVSRPSICSFHSFDDNTDDGNRSTYRQSRHYSMSALDNAEFLGQSRGNNNITTTRSMKTLPVTTQQDLYMSMDGGHFVKNNHYDRPFSSQSSLENTLTVQPVKDQEDYMYMFSPEDNYSNIRKKPGESFRKTKYIRKYNKKTHDGKS